MSSEHTERRRSGFALITVLWVMTVASVVALVAAVSGRATVASARNRVQADRALWTALGCARRMQATIDGLLQHATTLDEDVLIWRMLDRQVPAPALLQRSSCDVRLEAAGTRLNVNDASDEMMMSLLRALGESDGAASSMVDALADWRDSDDVARPAGAERDWYENAVRETPRNGPMADIKELGLVRGFEDLSRFDTVLTADPGRVSLATASVTVLRAIPGFTLETAELIVSLREAGTPVRDPASIVSRLSMASAEQMMARYPEIARLTTPDPDAWILTASASSGVPKTTVTVRWRLSRVGRRCLISDTRTFI